MSWESDVEKRDPEPLRLRFQVGAAGRVGQVAPFERHTGLIHHAFEQPPLARIAEPIGWLGSETDDAESGALVAGGEWEIERLCGRAASKFPARLGWPCAKTHRATLSSFSLVSLAGSQATRPSARRRLPGAAG